jgi:hypothetical protein
MEAAAMSGKALANLRSDLRATIADVIKSKPLEVVKRSPQLKFGWCRLHLKEAGYILRGECGTDRVVVWKSRKPSGTRVWFDSIDDLIDVVEHKRWNLLADSRPDDDPVETLLLQYESLLTRISEEQFFGIVCSGPGWKERLQARLEQERLR